MKKHLLYLCCMVLAITACQKTKPDANDINPIPEPVVKKYLVKEYYENNPTNPIRVIEWNDEFTQISHITTDSNTYYQLDYSFEYFGNDSMQVVLSKPENSWVLVLFTKYICHFDDKGRISFIDYYFNSNYQSSEKYNYDLSGRLISVVDEKHNVGTRFVWNGDNVSETYSISSGELTNSFDNFSDYIHPHYTLPYLLPDCNSYNFWHLTEPLWKNWYNYTPDMHYDYDSEGYVICSYRINDQGEMYAITKYEYSN